MYNTSYLERVSRKSEKYHAKYGNNPWKANCIFWLWNLTQLFEFKCSMRPKSDNVCHIGIRLRGGVGYFLISLNYLQNFHRFLGGAFAFDLYVQKKRGYCETVQALCREQNFVKQVLPSSRLKRDYDLYFELVRAPDILYFNESKIRSLCPQLHQWCLTVDHFRQENPVTYRYGTHGEAVAIKLAILQGHNRLQQGDIDNLVQVESVFQPKILKDTHETLSKFSLGNTRFITMQRGIGGGDRNVATKLWPLNHYETLAGLIKERMPEVRIVQIGAKENLLINGVDIDLRGKTSFEEVMVLLRQSSCHIDGECGLVHLRHFLRGGPSVVLFGPTDKHFYGYAENINIQSDACAGGCEWMTANYYSKCPRGFTENVCLSSLAPETVLNQVMKILEQQ